MYVEEIVEDNIGSAEMDAAIQAGSYGIVEDWGQGEMVAPIAKEEDQVEANEPDFVKETDHEGHDCHDCQIFDEPWVAPHVACHFEVAVP
ncbi:hypothetical protein SS1G_10694 [Sclerotinia sclerotiorum 1980 UF-70]|uniref:Uncharacterized protein n=1 Tax=Sclerotinia sclerotiorum (strain ATCC 18683 / 1980 / Ss-1) TaxID=665079 RepID=A7EZC7_SCLS1|nr:hypothetical protein SS1G_10694 [Sclerotinia sclerotiorum 1980 UF-70]EDN94819.1 hypothetical protein SS1G_10694 [Sclerotinia sclerotiorum 1980 UF-70]